MKQLITLSLGLGLAGISSASLVLDLDSTDLSSLTLSGSDVTGWKNGVGSQVFSPVATAPTYVTNVYNGHSAVRFAGGGLMASNFGGSATDLTIFLLVSPNSNAGGFRAYLSNTQNTSDDFSTGFNVDMTGNSSSSFDRLNVEGVKGGGGGGFQLRTGNTAFNAPVLVSVTYSSTVKAYFNGIAEGSVAGNGNGQNFDEMRVGSRFYGGGETGFLDGDIFAARIYDTALSDFDRAAVEAEIMGQFAPVPEPASMAALGVGALALLRRRKQK